MLSGLRCPERSLVVGFRRRPRGRLRAPAARDRQRPLGRARCEQISSLGDAVGVERGLRQVAHEPATHAWVVRRICRIKQPLGGHVSVMVPAVSPCATQAEPSADPRRRRAHGVSSSPAGRQDTNVLPAAAARRIDHVHVNTPRQHEPGSRPPGCAGLALVATSGAWPRLADCSRTFPRGFDRGRSGQHRPRQGFDRIQGRSP